ncbi:MAG: ornithine cyclodeaminase family protein [Silicimonas sp.]|nr:ornithine cyclodeaminase family protein [Silicimonas sp.]
MLYLSDDALEAMQIAPSEIADAIEAALADKSEGRLHVAPKSVILPGGGRYMMSTLAVGDFTVVKQVSVSPGNPEKGLPSINGAIVVLDAETGLLRAVMGANWITAHRTAALSAVAARRLADPASSTLAFVGCGVQAQSHLHAFKAMFPVSEVLAVGRSQATIDGFLAHARSEGFEARQAEPEQALRAADIVVTSITLNYEIAPFLDAAWLKPSAFAAITDLCIPWGAAGMQAFGTVVVDDMEQERTSEKPMLPPERVAGDLTDLVTGNVATRGADRPAAFAFRGIALGDYAAAALALKEAEKTGAGQRIG